MLFPAFIAGEKKHLILRSAIPFLFTIVACNTILIAESEASAISFGVNLNSEHGQFSFISPSFEPAPSRQIEMTDQPEITSFNWEYIYQTGYNTGLQIWLGINQILPALYRYTTEAKTIVHLMTGIPLSHIYTCPVNNGCTAPAPPTTTSYANAAASAHPHSAGWSCQIQNGRSDDGDPYGHGAIHTRINCHACGQYYCRRYQYSGTTYEESHPASYGAVFPGQSYEYVGPPVYSVPAATDGFQPSCRYHPAAPTRFPLPYDPSSHPEYCGYSAYPAQQQVDYSRPFGGVVDPHPQLSVGHQGVVQSTAPLQPHMMAFQQHSMLSGRRPRAFYVGVLSGGQWSPKRYSWMKGEHQLDQPSDQQSMAVQGAANQLDRNSQCPSQPCIKREPPD